MKKPQKPPSYLYPTLMVLGMGIAYGSLLVNQQFQVTLSVASMLSPTGARVTVGGFRVKHWISGLIILFFGVAMIFKNSKTKVVKELGVISVGMGAFLMLDEYTDIIRFITTGEYP